MHESNSTTPVVHVALHPIHNLLHPLFGIGWWLCLFSLNWQQKTEVLYLLTLLSPFFALYALWIVIPILMYFFASRWMQICLMWIDGLTVFAFGFYLLNRQFFRSTVQAYLSVDTGNRYSITGEILSFVWMAVALLVFGWFFFRKKKMF